MSENNSDFLTLSEMTTTKKSEIREKAAFLPFFVTHQRELVSEDTGVYWSIFPGHIQRSKYLLVPVVLGRFNWKWSLIKNQVKFLVWTLSVCQWVPIFLQKILPFIRKKPQTKNPKTKRQ